MFKPFVLGRRPGSLVTSLELLEESEVPEVLVNVLNAPRNSDYDRDVMVEVSGFGECFHEWFLRDSTAVPRHREPNDYFNRQG